MLIRRKVFSVLEDELGEERLYSTCDVDYLGDEYYDTESDRYFSDFDDYYDEREYSFDDHGNPFEAGTNMKQYRKNLKASNERSKVAERWEKNLHERRGKNLEKSIKGIDKSINEVTKKLMNATTPEQKKNYSAQLKSLQESRQISSNHLSKNAAFGKQGTGSVGQADRNAAQYIKQTTGVRGAMNRGKKAAMDRWSKLGKYGKAGVIAAGAVPVAAGLGYAGKKVYDHYNED